MRFVVAAATGVLIACPVAHARNGGRSSVAGKRATCTLTWALICLGALIVQGGCRAPTPTEDLFKAALDGNDAQARRDIGQGADVQAWNSDNNTPLMVAVKAGSVNVVKTLIKAGARVNDRGEYGDTPLIMAAEDENPTVISLLLASGADISAKQTGSTRSTALLEAAMLDKRASAQVLISAGADINVTSATGYTPLLWAAHNGDVALTKALLDAGADINSKGGGFYTPFTAAKLHDHADEVEFIVERGGHA
ncbi:MAG TPA: ankyrin repeat domain-containing protein [Caulobacteraceae bacterium]